MTRPKSYSRTRKHVEYCLRMKKLTKQNSSAITQLETAEALQMGMPLYYAAVIIFCF